MGEKKTPRTPKIGDTVKFFDERGNPYNGLVEKIREKGKLNLRVSRKPGVSQLYLSVTNSSSDEIKPRWN